MIVPVIKMTSKGLSQAFRFHSILVASLQGPVLCEAKASEQANFKNKFYIKTLLHLSHIQNYGRIYINMDYTTETIS